MASCSVLKEALEQQHIVYWNRELQCGGHNTERPVTLANQSIELLLKSLLSAGVSKHSSLMLEKEEMRERVRIIKSGVSNE